MVGHFQYFVSFFFFFFVKLKLTRSFLWIGGLCWEPMRCVNLGIVDVGTARFLHGAFSGVGGLQNGVMNPYTKYTCTYISIYSAQNVRLRLGLNVISKPPLFPS